jgi:hypothetical protein
MKVVVSSNGAVLEVTRDTVLIFGPDDTPLSTMIDDPADNYILDVSDALDFFHYDEHGEDLPDADAIAATGMDPSGRFTAKGMLTWKDIALKLIEDREKNLGIIS